MRVRNTREKDITVIKCYKLSLIRIPICQNHSHNRIRNTVSESPVKYKSGNSAYKNDYNWIGFPFPQYKQHG